MSDTDSNDFTLAGLAQVISEKYKPIRVGTGENESALLLQTARLPNEKQEALVNMQEEFRGLQEEGAKLNAEARDITPEQVDAWRQQYTEAEGHPPTEDEVDTWKKAEGSRTATFDEVKAFKLRTVEVIEKMLRTVAATEDDAERLIRGCNHDELILMEVFKAYSQKTKLGEASASPDSSESTAGPSTPTSASTTDSTSV